MPRARKIDLPAQLDAEYNVPEDASVEDLAGMAEQARADGLKILDDPKGGTASERVAKAEWLNRAAVAAQTRAADLVAAGEAEQAAIEAARAALGGTTAPANETDEEKAAREQKEREEAEAKAATDAAQASGGTGTVTDAATAAPVGEPALVAGAGSDPTARRSAVAAAASAGQAPSLVRQRSEGGEAFLTAASGVAGIELGKRIEWDSMGKIADNRFGSLPKHEGGSRTVLPIGQIHVPTNDGELVAAQNVGDDLVDASDAIRWALSMDRLAKEFGVDDMESLVAAGGWCAPSETLYDLLDLTTRDGLLDIPGITVNRGGVRFSLGPDFSAVYNAGANFTRTEAQAIAGTPTKPMVNIPCPSFTDFRMVVDGMYFTGDILSAKGYPEAYADFLGKASKAFAHYVNAQTIVDMVAGSTVVDYTAGPTKGQLAATTTILGVVEIQITDCRYKNRLSMTDTVEIIAPFWLKGLIRSDMAHRLGVEGGTEVTDAMIDNFFAIRGARVQWVYDWQDAFTGVSAGFGAATPILTWPTTVNLLIHPAGTFVRALNDVIELQAVYDSTLLQTNQFVALFTEQGRLTLKRAWDARNVKISVPVTGATALGVDYTLVANQPTV